MIARAEDESYGYVMSAYVMIRVARKCPSNRDELEGCGNPLPRLVQQHAEDILEMVEVSIGYCRVGTTTMSPPEETATTSPPD